MKKRKLITMVASMALVGLLGVGATLAYFTDSAAVENIITMSHVDISLTEHNVELVNDGERTWIQDNTEEGITESGISFEGVMPGDVLPKDPTVTIASDSANCYIRLRIELDYSDAFTSDDRAAFDSELDKAILTGWTFNNGYYYYPKELIAGVYDTAVLFEEIKIPSSWGNNVAEETFILKIYAEAIQSQNTDDIIEKDVLTGDVINWLIDANEIKAYNPK